MSLIRWDPFTNIATLQDRINRLFDDAFPRTIDTDEELSQWAWRPLVDIYETESNIIIQADLPGVNKDDVSVEVKENMLTIKGERMTDTEAEAGSYLQRERKCGAFQRSFAMRAMVAPNQIMASFKNGVLTVKIPKPEEQQPKHVTVNIE